MRRRIRISIPDGILNDYLKGMSNERAAYEIIRLATNNLQGLSDSRALNVVASTPEETVSAQVSNTPPQAENVKAARNSSKETREVSFEDDLQMLS